MKQEHPQVYKPDQKQYQPCHNFGMEKKEIPGDGVVSGFGLVNGRPVACAASDFLAQGGSLGYMDLILSAI